MKILYRMVFRSLIPVFLGILLISVTLFELVYFFAQLTRYLNDEAIGFMDYIKILGLYVPLAVSYSSPLSLLFALVFTLSSMYENREITVIHSGGISLVGFSIPILIFGLLLSLATFYFDNYIVTNAERRRNEHFSLVFERTRINRSEVVVAIAREGKRLYIASSFDAEKKELRELSIVDKDENGNMSRRIDSVRGLWDSELNFWRLQQARTFTYLPDNNVEEVKTAILSEPSLDEPPDSFQTQTLPIEEMSLQVAREYLDSLKRRKLPYLETAVSFYQRFTFPFTPLVVSLIGLAMVARFRQNTLLMSLLASIGIAVLFYISRLYAGIAGTQGYIYPWLSGALGILFFLIIGLLLFFKAPS